MITQNLNCNISFSHTFLEKVWQKAFDGSRPKFVFGFAGGKLPPGRILDRIPLTKTSPNFKRALFQVKENLITLCPLETKSVKRVRSFYQGEVRILSEGENFPPIEKDRNEQLDFLRAEFSRAFAVKSAKEKYEHG